MTIVRGRASLANSDVVYLPNHADLDATTAITVDLKFILPHTGTNADMLFWKESTYNLRPSTASGLIFAIGAQTVSVGSAIETNVPYHVACIYDGANLYMRLTRLDTGTSNLYSAAKTGLIPTSTAVLAIMNRNATGGTTQCDSATWEFRLWKNVALPTDQTTWDALIADFEDTSQGVPIRAYRLGQANPEPELNSGPDATVAGTNIAYAPIRIPEIDPAASARNIALVHDLVQTDAPDVFEALGHTVTEIDNDTIGAAYDFSSYDLIVVHRSTTGTGANTANIAAAIRASGKPAFIVPFGHGATGTGRTDDVAVALGLISSLAEGISTPSYLGNVDIPSVTHDLLPSLIHEKGGVQWNVHTQVSSPAIAYPDSGATWVGTALGFLPGTVVRPVFIAVETGTTDLNANSTAARYVVFSPFRQYIGYSATAAWWIQDMVEWLAPAPAGPTPPGTPSVSAVADSPTQFTATITPGSGATSHKLYVSMSPTNLFDEANLYAELDGDGNPI